MKINKQDILAGVRAGLPIVLGFIPVGIAYGIIAKNSGFTSFETMFMACVVHAGASQMMAVGMYASGAGIAAIVIATFIINLRHVIMSTCVFNCMQPLSARQKLFASFFITDETFAVVTSRKGGKLSFEFVAALGVVTYLACMIGASIGAIAVNVLPDILSESLGIALYAMFIGVIFPGIRGNSSLVILVAFTAVFNSVLTIFIPSSWAVVISTLVAAAIGTFFVNLDGNKNKNANGKEAPKK